MPTKRKAPTKRYNPAYEFTGRFWPQMEEVRTVTDAVGAARAYERFKEAIEAENFLLARRRLNVIDRAVNNDRNTPPVEAIVTLQRVLAEYKPRRARRTARV